MIHFCADEARALEALFVWFATNFHALSVRARIVVHALFT